MAVIGFHLNTVRYLPGGSLGVDVFFVLSGFLITSLLLEEWSKSGHISLRLFYLRRVLRLFPAVAVLLVVYSVVALAFFKFDFTGHQEPGLLLGNLAMAGAYLFNWLSATAHPRVWGLGHLWSLAVEEQFYLVWPALLLAALKLRLQPQMIIIGCLGLLAASASLAFTSLSYERLFFGTDFRLQELMTGSILAELVAAQYFRSEMLRNIGFRALLYWSIFSILALLLLLHDRHWFMSVGGYTYVALISGVIVLEAALNRSGIVCGLLAQKPIVYVGRRSYALYLWHYPVNYWLRGLDDLMQVVAVIGVTFVLAEVSFRLVERPAMQLKDKLTTGVVVSARTHLPPPMTSKAA